MSHALASPDPKAETSLLTASFACSLINGDPDAACVRVTGELDIATAPHLELTLRDAQAQARLVVLDLCELAFMDSAGLRAVVKATGHARADGRRLVVLPAPANVERLFRLAGVHECLERGAVAPATAPPRRHRARGRRSSRVSVGRGSRGAGATKPSRIVTRTLLTKALAAVPWLRTVAASELPGGTSTEAGATPHA